MVRRLAAMVVIATLAGCTTPEADSPADGGGDSAARDTFEDRDELPTGRQCNGSPSLCSRRLDQVVFATTHNSMSSAADDWFGPNQQFGIERQLADGVRAMMWDTHWDDGVLHLCHGLCGLGSIPLSEALGTLRAFLEGNPHEVVVLLIEDQTPVAETSAAFEESGLGPYLAILSTDALPTLDTLIDAGTRLIVTAQSGAPPPAWYHNVWSLTSDTGYTWNSPQDFTCDCNRGCPANARPLFLLNHWVQTGAGLPDPSQAEKVNSYDVLYERATACWQDSGRLPNFVAVDHYAVGDLFAVVNALNAL